MDPGFLADALTQVGLPGQVAVLALLLGCGIWTAVRPGVLPLVGLSACAAIWLRANSHLEGVVLITVSREHGLTLADLLVPALGCVVLLSRRAVLNRPVRLPGRRAAAATTTAPGQPTPEQVRQPVGDPAVPAAGAAAATAPYRAAGDPPARPPIPSPRPSAEPARPVRH
jgi:hypothetical protein